MASAVMASRNEPYWGETKTYNRKFPDSNNLRLNVSRNPIQNPNPNADNAVSNPNSERRNVELIRSHNGDAVVREDDCNEMSGVAYQTFNRADYTMDELKELKKRFTTELEQVRTLRRRIESGRFCSRSGHPAGAAPPVNQRIHSFEASANPMPAPKTNQYHQHHQQPEVLKAVKKPNPNPNQHARKNLSGIKRSNSKAPVSDSKRPRANPGAGKLMNSMKKRCGDILAELMRSKFGWVFNKPVDVVKLGLHDYHRIIKNPMDLGTVKSKLRKNAYATPLDFAADIQLTFDNAMLYNPEGQDVHVMAKGLLSNFHAMFGPLKKRYEDEFSLMMAAEEAQLLNQHHALPSPPSSPVFQNARAFDQVAAEKKSEPIPQQLLPLRGDSVKPLSLPNPEANREMSYDEKVMLGMSLQNLPSEKMEQLLSIIKRRSGFLDQDGDEIELDIDIMDNETLWELHRFVHNKLDQDEIPSISEPKNKKSDAGDEDVDIGEEIPMSHFPPVEIERDDNDGNASSRLNNSGSSCSSSGSSSSSGSDSGSSSGSDSDADSAQSPYVELKDVGHEGVPV